MERNDIDIELLKGQEIYNIDTIQYLPPKNTLLFLHTSSVRSLRRGSVKEESVFLLGVNIVVNVIFLVYISFHNSKSSMDYSFLY